MIDRDKFHTFSSGLWVANCTPHPIRFLDGEEIITVEPCGATLVATPEENLFTFNGWLRCNYAEFVRTHFVPSEIGNDELLELGGGYTVLPIGSIVSAQAWPGRVVSLVPILGYERKPPEEKLYRADKFNVF